MESEVPEKRPGSDSGQVLQMLEEGAPLFRYTGPILLLNREKKIVGANPAALSLVHGIMSGSAQSVIALVTEALSESPRLLILHIRTVYNLQAGSATLSLLIAFNRSERVFLFNKVNNLTRSLWNRS